MLTNAQLHSLYMVADAMLFPSRQEGFGLPLLEAAAHRLPVFCSNIEPLKSIALSGTLLFDLRDAPRNIAERIRDAFAKDAIFKRKKQLLQRLLRRTALFGENRTNLPGPIMNSTLAPHDIHRLLNAEHDDPFGVLGLHKIDGLWVVRAFRPDAKELLVIDRNNPERHFPANPYRQRRLV